MATDVVFGDKIRADFAGEVCCVNDDGTANVAVAVGLSIIHVENIPASKMVVTKAVAPPQPSIGSLIVYYGDKYIRTAAGWSLVRAVNGSMVGSPNSWDTFDHRAVRLFTAGAPLVSR